MKPDASKISNALHDWVSEDIKTTTSRYYDLGKYLFTISTGTALFITTIKTIFPNFSYSITPILISFAFLAVSLVVCVILLLPKEWKLDGTVVLEDELGKQIDRYQALLWIWFAYWLIGLAAGVFSLFIGTID